MAVFFGTNCAGCGLHELAIPILESPDAVEVRLLVRVLLRCVAAAACFTFTAAVGARFSSVAAVRFMASLQHKV